MGKLRHTQFDSARTRANNVNKRHYILRIEAFYLRFWLYHDDTVNVSSRSYSDAWKRFAHRKQIAEKTETTHFFFVFAKKKKKTEKRNDYVEHITSNGIFVVNETDDDNKTNIVTKTDGEKKHRIRWMRATLNECFTKESTCVAVIVADDASFGVTATIVKRFLPSVEIDFVTCQYSTLNEINYELRGKKRIEKAKEKQPKKKQRKPDRRKWWWRWTLKRSRNRLQNATMNNICWNIDKRRDRKPKIECERNKRNWRGERDEQNYTGKSHMKKIRIRNAHTHACVGGIWKRENSNISQLKNSPIFRFVFFLFEMGPILCRFEFFCFVWFFSSVFCSPTLTSSSSVANVLYRRSVDFVFFFFLFFRFHFRLHLVRFFYSLSSLRFTFLSWLDTSIIRSKEECVLFRLFCGFSASNFFPSRFDFLLLIFAFVCSSCSSQKLNVIGMSRRSSRLKRNSNEWK